MPSLSGISLAMRFSPWEELFMAISRISCLRSAGIGGRPVVISNTRTSGSPDGAIERVSGAGQRPARYAS